MQGGKRGSGEIQKCLVVLLQRLTRQGFKRCLQFLPRLRQRGPLILQAAGGFLHPRFGYGPALTGFGQGLPQLTHICLLVVQTLLKRGRQHIGPLRAFTALDQLGMETRLDVKRHPPSGE